MFDRMIPVVDPIWWLAAGGPGSGMRAGLNRVDLDRVDLKGGRADQDIVM